MLRRVGGCVAACLAWSLIATGCGSPSQEAGTPTPSPSSAGSPLPSSDPVRDAARVKQAVIPIALATQLGLGTPTRDSAVEVDEPSPAVGCLPRKTDPTASKAYDRHWNERGEFLVFNTAYVMVDAWPVDLVKRWGADVPRCKPYKSSGTTFTYVQDVQLPTGPSFRGVDAGYAFCEKVTNADGTAHVCRAYLARGSLLSTLDVMDRRESNSLSGSESLLKILAAAAAEALAAA